MWKAMYLVVGRSYNMAFYQAKSQEEQIPKNEGQPYYKLTNTSNVNSDGRPRKTKGATERKGEEGKGIRKVVRRKCDEKMDGRNGAK